MGLFNKKPKIVKEISGGAWGHMVNVHGMDVDTLSKDVRCVEREGIEGNKPVTFMRVFKLSEVAKKGVEVTGWETFDQHPELVLFEGYLNKNSNEAHLERKKS